MIEILKQEDKWSSFPVLLKVTMINRENKQIALEKCDGFLEKPIDNEILIETFDHILKK